MSAPESPVALTPAERGTAWASTAAAAPPAAPGRPPARGRRGALAATLAIVAAGLALRGFGPALGLPFAATKYGGSVLWGAMVYRLGAALAPAAPRGRLAAAALLAAAAVEASRLLHAPALDAFRLTGAGALLLGRVFSPWNVVAYAAGIAAAAARDRGPGRPAPGR